MFRKIVLVTALALPLALLSALGSAAQTTTVTGTVADANGNAYFPGTVSAAVILNTGQPLPAGVPASGSIGPFPTTSGGNFSVAVASPLTWVFTICGSPVNIGPRVNPTPTQVCFSTPPIAISGASQAITSSFPTVPLLGPNSGGTATNATNLVGPGSVSGAFSGNATFTGGVNFDGDVHNKGPNPWLDATRFGARALAAPASTTTGSITSGQPTLTLASALDFVNGEGIAVQQAGPTTALSTPGAPTSVVPKGVTGSTTHTYRVVAEDFNNALTAAGTGTATTTSAAVLGTNSCTGTAVIRTAGVVTFTCNATHNFQAANLVNITGSGFTGINLISGPAGDYRGVNQITSVGATTFTITQQGRIDFVSQTITDTAQVLAHIFVTWTGQANVLRWWVYRDGALVGVAQGTEPFFDDVGADLDTATIPAYVPLTPPGAVTNGILSTTIWSGAGTTIITLSANASNTATTKTVLHDACPNLLSAVSSAIISGTGGGRIFFPFAGFGIGYNVNSACQIPQTNSTVTFSLAGSFYLYQPLIPSNRSNWEGYASPNIGQPSFSTTYYAPFLGNSYPLIFIPTRTAIEFNHVYVGSVNNQQWGMLVDGSFGGGGSVNITVKNSFFNSARASSGNLILRGVGFGYNIDTVTTNQGGGAFWSKPTIELQNGATNSPAGFPGIGVMRNIQCQTTCIGTNGDTGPTSNAGSPWTFDIIFTEGIVKATFDFRNITTTNWYDWTINNVQSADGVAGNGTPLIDFSGSTSPIGMRITNIPNSGQVVLATTTSVSGLNLDNVGGAQNSLSPVGQIANYTHISPDVSTGTGGVVVKQSIEHSGVMRLKGNTTIHSDMPSPTAVVGTVAAGGSVPVGTWYYTVTAVGWNNGESASGSVSQGQVTSGGNQTVNLTWVAPSPSVGVQGYNVYRSNGGGFSRVATLVATTSFSDTAAAGSGQSISNTSGTGASYFNNAEVSSPQFRLPSSDGALFSSAETGRFTATRTVTVPDASGTQVLTGVFNSIYDNFNRANAAIGANWSVNTGGFNVASNALVGTGAGNNTARYSALSFSGNSAYGQFSESTITALNGGTDFIGPSVFIQNSGENRYTCMETTTTIFIQRSVAASTFTLASSATTGAGGDVLRIEATVSGSTTTLTCFKNGVQVLTATDTNFISGSPGIFQFGNVATQDNWSGGNFHPIGHLDLEQDWTQPQHFASGLTVGAPTNVPITNMTFQDCGTTSTCSKTQQAAFITVKGGPIALAAGTLTVTALPFTSSTSYVCSPDDSTGINGIDVIYNSGSSVTFNGTGTDSIRYVCQGN